MTLKSITGIHCPASDRETPGEAPAAALPDETLRGERIPGEGLPGEDMPEEESGEGDGWGTEEIPQRRDTDPAFCDEYGDPLVFDDAFAHAVSLEDVRVLAEADAQAVMERGVDAMIAEIAGLEGKPFMRERERLLHGRLTTRLGLIGGALELQRGGVDVAEVLRDERFVELSGRLREGTSLADAYGLYERLTRRGAPKSTGSVRSGGDARDKAFFAREDVEAMTKGEIRRNFEAIERSMRQWG